METQELQQRSKEWHEARRNRLTASDYANAAGLVGAYQSRARTWAVKLGEIEIEINPAMQFGIDNEENARDDYEIATGNISMPTGFYIHPLNDWRGASPDGIIGGETLHEVKCRATTPYEDVSSLHFCQIQGQLACTGLKRCHYQSWTPDSQRIWEVAFNPEYWEWLVPYLQEFWTYVQNLEEPPRRKRISFPGNTDVDLLYSSNAHIM